MAEYIDRAELSVTPIDITDLPADKCLMVYLAEDVDSLPTADVVEDSTMRILCKEYLSKCNCCDECCAETYCILNSLRTENRDCVSNLITYFTERNIGE